MKISAIAAVILALVSLSLSGCETQTAESHEAAHAETSEAAHGETHGETHEEGHHEHVILVTSPLRKDVISTQQYVCQIHSCQHIEVRALEGGYLEEIRVNEGQAVKKGDLMFKILPTLFQAKLNAEVAEANRIGIELKNAQTLNQKGIVSPQELAIKQAELAKAQAKVELARAELDFTNVTAPFDGIVDRQHCQLGSLIEDGDVLTTYSDNSVMWVYFNVPEARYLEYKSDLDDNPSADPLQIELKLANGKVFSQPGKIGAIEADFNNTTGNIAFRADFDNPKGLLRNGQTGTILIHRTLKDVIVIPQRATYEILAKRYAFVVDKDNVVHQRDLTIESEQDDIFVIKDGLEEGDKIILEGIRQVRDGDKIEFKYTAPEEVLGNLKYHAE
ncbi:efflux RND transporter periplasmic adaptor subunit [Blastopirellula sp. J2-11]|uniref:efflux RND transporter periplasmic adaptor subunit n=1 Tax=Blastopirellula sp. J2-11 TaxID=2943192 RepID=UPI0021CA68E0|nr:efflux RND transporter periplasmic adaptor subunit [Blastopirellula sp. J2-11]UUO04605.1 efflux RND transporter periplasmic adaptor subunit [Blastopirellula sp. J2-11]